MGYTKEDIQNIVSNQRKYFNTHETLDIKNRISNLKKLRNAIISNEAKITEALFKDLGRSDTEAYLLDIGDTIMEINECIHGLRKWARPETLRSGLHLFPSTKTKVYKMPYGVTLIVAPFNFPVLLSLGVACAAIAGGNTVVIKMSSKTVNTTEAIKQMIDETFDKKFMVVIDGGHDVADYCLEEKFDKIFYTGSPNIGKHVMEEASRNLTPIALELGGETGNFAIVRSDANIKDAARKIAFFKLVNSGQVCININQVAVSNDIKDEFVEELKKEIERQIGSIHPSEVSEYPRLVDKRSYEKCRDEAYLYKDRIVFGGSGDDNTLKFDTTIIYPVSIDENICKHELFNPLLPIIPFDDNKIDDLLKVIRDREHGLAFYLFTKDIKWAKKTMKEEIYGGGCINEVCVHMMVKGAPFNGVGHSGMGAYHGVWGFREFTHPSTVLFGKTHMNLSLREHPYNKKFLGIEKINILKKFMK